MAAITTELSAKQIEQFRADGFLSIEALTTAEEVARFRKIYDRLFEQRVGRDAGQQHDLAGTDEDDVPARLPQILKSALHEHAPEFGQSTLLANAARISRQIFGPDCLCEVQHAILKPAGYGPATPWHQDSAYMGGEAIVRTFSFWVPLQEATIENGCLHFVPASHRSGTFEHRSMNNDPRIHALELTPETMSHVVDPVPCPLPPGGATIHDAHTLHYAGPNLTGGDRRALIIKAQIEPLPTKHPRSFPWLEAYETARAKRTEQQSSP